MKYFLMNLRWLRRSPAAALLWACVWLPPLDISAANKENTQPMGLSVRNGVLMRQGKPYAGIGANYDTLFGRLLQDKGDVSSLHNLGLLADKGIPFVRFRACGFYPRNAQLYLENRAEYFRRMDQVVQCAEQHQIGLIPSLFWHLGTVTDLVGEAPRELGNPKSKAIAYIKKYTHEMVLRYKDSPAIWAWEFGNEANLGVDLLPSSSRRRRAATPSEDGSVRLTTDQLQTAYSSFARVVRSIDPSRAIDSGTSVPRPAAWHNALGQFRRPDSEAQTYAMLLRQNPDPINLLSVHVYQKSQKLLPYGPETVDHFIGRYAKFAAQSGKPLFLGEFPVRDKDQANEYLRAIVTHRVPLSAFWTFDNAQQDRTMSVTFRNNRSFVVDLIARANRDLQGVP